MSRSRQNSVIIAGTIAMLVLVAAVIVIVWGFYSNWFATSFERIYLSNDGERLQQADSYRLGDVELDVHQFGLKTGYTVKIVPAANCNFTYIVDGRYFNFIEELADKDVSAAFDIRPDTKSFVVHARDLYVTDVIAACYPDSEEVRIISQLEEPIYYKLVVTDEEGSNSFVLTFRCMMSVTDVEMDPGHVYA